MATTPKPRPKRRSTATKTPRKHPVTKRKPIPAASHEISVAVRSTRAHRVKTTYVYAVGRRKSAVARVRLHPDGTAGIVVNGMPYTSYFPTQVFQQRVLQPLILTGRDTGANITVKVAGGGKRGQADAVCLGIARALTATAPELRSTLKKNGLLRRDARVKERKKYGLKRARRAPQWQKR